MKITYDRRSDSLSVILKEGVAVAEGDEDKPGVILDNDEHGGLARKSRFSAHRVGSRTLVRSSARRPEPRTGL
jgi:hypothetical protein